MPKRKSTTIDDVDADTHNALAAQILRILAGHEIELQGAVLADVLAAVFACYACSEQTRNNLLDKWMKTVRAEIPVFQTELLKPLRDKLGIKTN